MILTILEIFYQNTLHLYNYDEIKLIDGFLDFINLILEKNKIFINVSNTFLISTHLEIC